MDDFTETNRPPAANDANTMPAAVVAALLGASTPDGKLRGATSAVPPYAAEPPTFVKKSTTIVTGSSVDMVEALTRHLVKSGTDLAQARTLAEVAAAMERKAKRRGRKQKGPRLCMRNGSKTVWIKDVGHLESTGFQVAKGQDFRSHPGAVAALAEYVERKVRRILGRVLKKDVTVSQVFIEFLVNHKPGETADQRDKDRFQAYENALVQLEEFFGSASLASLGINSGKQYQAFRTNQPIKNRKKLRKTDPATSAAQVDILIMVLDWFCEEHAIDPIRIRRPRLRATGVVWLTWDQLIRLIRAARGAVFDEGGKLVGSHDRAGRYACVVRFILIYLYGGTRHQNILQLMWAKDPFAGHVDAKRKKIERQGNHAVITSKRRGTSSLLGSLETLVPLWEAEDREARIGSKSTNRYRHVIHDEEGRPLLRKTGRSSGHFPSQTMARLFNEVRTLAGLPEWVTPHVLKHTGVSLCAKAGMSPVQLSVQFSTSVATLFGTYAHLADDFINPAPFRRENLRLMQLRRFSPRSVESLHD